MIADLHCHSRLSDGSLGIDEIVFFSKRAGLAFLSLTDHDTMSGVVRAQVLGRRYGIEVIPGVEISSFDPESGKRVHVLCYLPEKPDRLEGLLKATLTRRTAAGVEMLRRVMRLYPLTAEQAAKYYTTSQSIYRVHIMHALLDLGYDDQLFGTLYEDLFGTNKRCDVPMEYPPLDEVLDLIGSAQGIAVIAHPGKSGLLALCERLSVQGRIQGIEVYHPSHTRETCEQLLALCTRFNLIGTGGTDFHGSYYAHPNPLATCMAPLDAIGRLFKRRGNSL